ncbi:conserved hypothetical protein [Histoplasma capsulatum G186AR]|uniref:Uncharacterized protein n=1 Tax=Ajellomyces capsulatus (strain G186AR / H82 / ATCC MYA-2454 / RMSCC 2432) TaxID=447093 RepID=C0NPT6_AJECG|nr:uncharacterized protein HCBG_05166 [Histoplasma capsulatum G186AR]EEH06946.1 conserved hypothetical protein [Histoplasma capsulatum G186AR]
MPLKLSPWDSGLDLRIFDILPDRISANVEEFRVEAWMHLDRRIQLHDITDRMHPEFRIAKNALQQCGVRFRQAFSILSWGSGNKQTQVVAEQLEKEMEARGIDLALNSTCSLMPGLINLALGEAGGRITVPEAYRQQNLCELLQSSDLRGKWHCETMESSRKMALRDDGIFKENGAARRWDLRGKWRCETMGFENDILAAAAAIPRGQLRSGGVRRPLPPPRARARARARPRPSALALALALAREGGGEEVPETPPPPLEDEEDELDLSNSPCPQPPPSSSGSFSPLFFAEEGVPLEPINWQASQDGVGIWLMSKSSSTYQPQESGKWWSVSHEEFQCFSPQKQRVWGHIGRIMETELGEQLLGEDRCAACQENGEECWAYSEKGRAQIAKPGDSCSRCRVAARKGGCSISKRKPKDPRTSPPSRPHQLLPKGPPPPPPGSSALTV